MSVRVFPNLGAALPKAALLSVCAAALVAAAACNSEKSRNPLSPTVAGPIAGVTISSPKPLEPANGKEIDAGQLIDLTIENASTTGERPLWQQIEVALDGDFTSKVHTADKVSLGANGRTTYRMPSALTGGRAYFWRVRALDGANTGPYSGPAMFRVIVPVIIEPPTPVSPIADAVTSTRAPQLVVRNNAVTGPAGDVYYHFEVSTNPEFTNLVGAADIPRAAGQNTTLNMHELAADTRYFWRAIGTNGTVNSAWAPTQSFKTPAPPPPAAPPPTTPTPPPSGPNPQPPPPNNPPPAPPGTTRNISAGEALDIIRNVHDSLGYNLGSSSSREGRVQFFWTAVAVVHFGHARFNPRGGDPGWCVKDAGGGRPPSDDVLVRCSSRESWDLIGGAGANGYSFHLDFIGILSSEQNVYPPPASSLPR